MIDLEHIDGIYLFTGATDMRCGIETLSALVSQLMDNKAELKNKLFVFCSKDKRNLKVIEIDYDGWWLYQKKLVTGKFKWPKKQEDCYMIDKRQLMWLLDGLSVMQKTAHLPVNFE